MDNTNVQDTPQPANTQDTSQAFDAPVNANLDSSSELSVDDIILGNEKSRYINVHKCAVDIAKYYGGDINARDINDIEDIIFKHINLTNKGGK